MLDSEVHIEKDKDPSKIEQVFKNHVPPKLPSKYQRKKYIVHKISLLNKNARLYYVKTGI